MSLGDWTGGAERERGVGRRRSTDSLPGPDLSFLTFCLGILH